VSDILPVGTAIVQGKTVTVHPRDLDRMKNADQHGGIEKVLRSIKLLKINPSKPIQPTVFLGGAK